jgi:hypothetical protein
VVGCCVCGIEPLGSIKVVSGSDVTTNVILL